MTPARNLVPIKAIGLTNPRQLAALGDSGKHSGLAAFRDRARLPQSEATELGAATVTLLNGMHRLAASPQSAS